MKRFQNLFFFFILTCLFTDLTAQNIQVNDTYTAQNLVQNVLVNSTCASVSNFSVSGGNFGTSEQSYGYFTAGTSGFPFANGIVLSTSRAVSTEGPNVTILSEDASGWLGDSDLEQALQISNTSDATSLEFDFTPLTNKISFDYIFASEEYHDNAQCRYSDGFAFLLKVAGSTNTYQNLALIPGTQTPVKVTSVHPAAPACQAENEQYFGNYNGTIAPINFNGQTKIMTAQADVTPGVTYHMKLVIADETNPQYDSAIFLGGGSFLVKTDLGTDKLLASNTAICYGSTYTLNAYQNPNDSYKWFKNNVVLNGETNATLVVNSAGIYAVEVTLFGTTCISKGEVKIEFTAQPATNTLALVQCDDDNDGISVFNLTKLEATISGSATIPSGVTFYESLYNAQNSFSQILNTTNYPNLTTNILFAKYTNTNGCSYYTQINLSISNNSITNQNPIAICDEDALLDGISSFNLATQATPQLLLNLPTGLIVEYYSTLDEAIAQTTVLSTTFTNTTPFQQTIFARIINGTDCYGIKAITLKVNIFNPIGFEDETLYLCNKNPIQIAVPNSYSSYLWSTGATTNSSTVLNQGNYTVEVTNADGCKKTKIFHVLESSSATITSIDVNDFLENNNTVLINYTGIGAYEFSLDGIYFQNSPLFYNVLAGEYQVTINDIYGCSTTTSNLFYVLDFPQFFTPNDDGYNDFWKIPNIESQANWKIYIYDRYGKFIKKMTSNDDGWDGKLNNIPLPSDDYWFYLVLNNTKVIKSHFALKR